MQVTLKGKRVVTYARYSSDLQRDASIEDQQHGAKEFIEKHGGNPNEAVQLGDRAESAASLDREGLQRSSRWFAQVRSTPSSLRTRAV